MENLKKQHKRAQSVLTNLMKYALSFQIPKEDKR